MTDLDELDKYYSKKFSSDYSTDESNDKKLVATINTIEQTKTSK